MHTKQLIFACIFITPSAVIGQEPTPEEQTAQALALVEHHLELFNRSDAKTISQHTVAAMVRVNRNETLQVMATAEDVENFFARAFQHLKTKQWFRSVTNRLDAHFLKDGSVIVDYEFTREREDGTAIETLSVYYDVKRTDKGWRIAGIHGHQLDRRVQVVEAARSEGVVTQAEAEAAMKRYIAAWSTKDARNVRDIVFYPHVIHRANFERVLVYQSPDEYPIKRWATYFQELQESGYDHSELVETKLLYSTPLEATVLVEWKRITTEGEEMLRGESIYILARKKPGDELRVQIRHSPRRLK